MTRCPFCGERGRVAFSAITKNYMCYACHSIWDYEEEESSQKTTAVKD